MGQKDDVTSCDKCGQTISNDQAGVQKDGQLLCLNCAAEHEDQQVTIATLSAILGFIVGGLATVGGLMDWWKWTTKVFVAYCVSTFLFLLAITLILGAIWRAIYRVGFMLRKGDK